MYPLTVIVLDQFPREETYQVEIPFYATNEPLIFLYVAIPRGAITQFIETVLNKLDSNKKSVDGIFIRLHEPELSYINANAYILDELTFRFKETPIFIIVWYENAHHIYHRHISPQARYSIDAKNLLNAFRQAELIALINKPNVLLQEAEGYHYIGPNGKHYKTFLRVGNALYSKDILDSISFWLLPYLMKSPLILLDSGSILSLGLNLVHYCYDCKHLKGNDWFGKVECFTSYYEDELELIRRLSEQRKKDLLPKHVLNILSARGTGSLSKRLKTVCSSLNLKIEGTICLFAVPDQNSENDIIFCQLPEDFQKLEFPCPLCAKDSIALKIDEKTYSLEIEAEAKPIAINVRDAESVRDFFTNYPDSGSFSVHKKEHDGRHHLISIDVQQLLKNKKFKERVIFIAESFKENIDVILTPEHPAALEMSLVVSEVIKVPVIQSDHKNLGKLKLEDSSLIKKSKNILIIDDVVITGSRINNYKEYLNRYDLRNDSTVVKLLVGIARPKSNNSLIGIKNYLRHPKNFACAEELILPDWDERTCPWCWELEMMLLLGGKFTSSTALEKRFEQLSDDNGIKDNLFLSLDKDTPLTHGTERTIFGPMHSEVEIFVAIASTIQHLREIGKLNKSYSKPIARVFDLDMYIAGRFYENFIRAAIIRASFKKDIRASSIEAEQKEIIEKLLYRTDHAIPFRAEILLAVAQQKLPMVKINDSLFNGDVGICSFLKLLLEHID